MKKKTHRRKRAKQKAWESETYCCHIQEFYKNTKLVVIIHTQMTRCRPMKSLCMLHQSLWVHLSPDDIDLEALVFLMSYMSSGSQIIFASSFTVYPETLMEEINGDMWFRTEYSRNLDSLHSVWLLFSLYVTICCRRKIL